MKMKRKSARRIPALLLTLVMLLSLKIGRASCRERVSF